MRLYVAGPMTNLPGHNLPAFAEATRRLTAAGYDAVNPGREGVIPGYTWQDYMRRALADLITCDGVALLPGWEHSPGTQVEVYVAAAIGAETRPLAAWLAQEPVR